MASGYARAIPTASGVGLRLPHLADVVATHPPAAWLEIHPENFLANPHAAELLIDIARDYLISIHSVGVSIGSVSGIDRAHLARVGALVDRIDPILVSGHLAWSTHAGEYHYLSDAAPERCAFDPADVCLEIRGARGKFRIEHPCSRSLDPL